MKEKISLRERFRRFILRLFKGVPYEEYEGAQEELRAAHIEIVSLNTDLDKANREIDNLKEDIKRKDGSIAFSHRFGSCQPVKLRTKRIYSNAEYCDMIRRNAVLNDLARDFMPAVERYMWWKVENTPQDYTATAELWLYPIGNKGEVNDDSL